MQQANADKSPNLRGIEDFESHQNGGERWRRIGLKTAINQLGFEEAG